MAATQAPKASLRIQRTLKAPREKVFEAWTRAEALKSWFCHEGYTVLHAEADARAGGGYLIRMVKNGEKDPFHVAGTYKEVRRPDRLVFTWKWSHREEMNDTVVTVDLAEEGRATRLTLVHELFESGEMRDEHNLGWGKVLDALDGYLG